MSRLCRLKTKSNGEDGLWAYQEITQLRAKVAELEAKLEKYQKLEPVAWLHTFEKQNGDRETDASISFAVAKVFCDFGDPIPLYALEMK